MDLEDGTLMVVGIGGTPMEGSTSLAAPRRAPGAAEGAGSALERCGEGVGLAV